MWYQSNRYLHQIIAGVIRRKGIRTFDLWFWRPLFYHWNYSPKRNGYWLMEFAFVCVYLVINLLFSLILIGVFFLFASSSNSTYPEKLCWYLVGMSRWENLCTPKLLFNLYPFLSILMLWYFHQSMRDFLHDV